MENGPTLGTGDSYNDTGWNGGTQTRDGDTASELQKSWNQELKLAGFYDWRAMMRGKEIRETSKFSGDA